MKELGWKDSLFKEIAIDLKKQKQQRERQLL